MPSPRTAIYPGTFDPITNGHMDMIRRATRVADHLIVAVARNAGKNPLLGVDERVELVRAEIADLNNPVEGRKVEARPFDNLLMHFAQSVGACLIVRGLRAVSDFEYEFQMAGMNARLDPNVETAERIAYLRMSKKRRGGEEEAASEAVEEEAAEAAAETVTLTPERFAALEAKEEFILTVTAKGFGKRSSAYEYRITGRGGQGIAAIEMSDRNGQVVASFPVGHRDQIMLVTDRGQLIRCPVTDIRIAGRKTQGVVLFKIDEGEKVVSVTRLNDETQVPEGVNGEEGGGADA